jgi:hypothetical protein
MMVFSLLVSPWSIESGSCAQTREVPFFFKFKILYFVFITYLEEEDDARLLHRVVALICLVLVKLFLNYFL